MLSLKEKLTEQRNGSWLVRFQIHLCVTERGQLTARAASSPVQETVAEGRKAKQTPHVAARAQLVPAGKATLPTDFHPAMSPTQLVHLCHFIKGCKMQCTNSITPLTFISSNSL